MFLHFGGAEYDLIDSLSLTDLPTGHFSRPKKFFQHGSVTWIWELGFEVIADEVEEGFDIGIQGVFG